jgi:hypothetical protein
MRKPPRRILQSYGLPWMVERARDVESDLKREITRGDKEAVIEKFVRIPPDNFPERYGDAYKLEVYWREVAIPVWHLFCEHKKWVDTAAPLEDLPLFKELPALEREYTVPTDGVGNLVTKPTQLLNRPEVLKALERVRAEMSALEELARRLEMAPAS